MIVTDISYFEGDDQKGQKKYVADVASNQVFLLEEAVNISGEPLPYYEEK